MLVPFTGDNLLELARGYDVVAATVYTSVELVERVQIAYPEILPAYYIQDYEPLFFDETSDAWRQGLRLPTPVCRRIRSSGAFIATIRCGTAASESSPRFAGICWLAR